MSDAKKGASEEAAGGNPFVDGFFWVLLVLAIIGGLKSGISSLGLSFDFLPSLSDIFASIFNTFQIFSVFLSLLFFIGIIYYNHLLGQLLGHGHGHGGHGGGHGGHGHDDHGAHDTHHADSHSVHHTDPVEHAPAPKHVENKRWTNVLNRLASHSEGDWRLAIIEADIILDDMLSRMGYHGEGIGEKLKQVEKSDFATLDEAWEAHKVRNRIAHDGASYKMPHHDAERVIGLYKKVFEEFYFI